MKCKYSDLVKKYFNEDITFGDIIELKQHINQCHSCRTDYEFLDKFINNVKKLNETKIEVSDNFTKEILEKLPEQPRKNLIRTTNYTGLRWAIAIASFVIIVLGIYFINMNNLNNIKLAIVSFEVNAPEAQSVSIAGDFNNWDCNKTKLINHNGTWKITLNLKPGHYQYMFVIDGKKWAPDPNAKEYIDDGYGNKNSIIDIL
jgi:1,4-alpha-glucan branching enzyme